MKTSARIWRTSWICFFVASFCVSLETRAEKAPSKDKEYLAIPIKGQFGKDITAEAVEHSLIFAGKHKISHVVFFIDSDGGDVETANRILDILEKYDDQFTYHAAITKALSASIWVVFGCDTIHMAPKATIGAAIAFSTDGQGAVKVEEKINSALAARIVAVAETKGHSSVLVRAMAVQGATAYVHTNAEGKPTITADQPNGKEFVTLDSATTVLTLTGAESVRIGFGKKWDGTDDSLGKDLELQRWIQGSNANAFFMAQQSLHRLLEVAGVEYAEVLRRRGYVELSGQTKLEFSRIVRVSDSLRINNPFALVADAPPNRKGMEFERELLKGVESTRSRVVEMTQGIADIPKPTYPSSPRQGVVVGALPEWKAVSELRERFVTELSRDVATKSAAMLIATTEYAVSRGLGKWEIQHPKDALDAMAMEDSAQVMEGNGDYAGARKQYEVLNKRFPEYYRRNLIDAQLKDKRFQANANKASEEKNAKENLSLAKSYIAAGRIDLAARLLRKVVSESPGTAWDTEAQSLLKSIGKD